MSALFGMQVAPPVLGDVALGLASVLARFDRLLAEHAPPCAATDPLGADDGRPVEADDATFAVLGLVALRGQLGRTLDAAHGTEPRAATATAPAGGSLLR